MTVSRLQSLKTIKALFDARDCMTGIFNDEKGPFLWIRNNKNYQTTTIWIEKGQVHGNKGNYSTGEYDYDQMMLTIALEELDMSV